MTAQCANTERSCNLPLLFEKGFIGQLRYYYTITKLTLLSPTYFQGIQGQIFCPFLLFLSNKLTQNKENYHGKSCNLCTLFE